MTSSKIFKKVSKYFLQGELGNLETFGSNILQAKSRLDKGEDAFGIVKRLFDAEIPIYLKNRTKIKRTESFFLAVTVTDPIRSFLFYKRVRKDTKIKDLKRILFMNYAIHPADQSWNVGTHVCGNEERLCDLDREYFSMYFPMVVTINRSLTWPNNIISSTKEQSRICGKCGKINHEMSVKCCEYMMENEDNIIQDVRISSKEQLSSPNEFLDKNITDGNECCSPEGTLQTYQPPQGKWICAKCTFENDNGRPGCEMCSAAPPPASTASTNARPVSTSPLPVRGGTQHRLEPQNGMGGPCRAYGVAPSKSPLKKQLSYQDSDDEQTLETFTPPPDEWICPKCTFVNTRGRPGCEICGSEPPSASTAAAAASTPKPKAVQKEPERRPSPKINKQLSYQDSDDEQTLETFTPPPNTWTCGKCTYVNKKGRPGCEICGAEPPPDTVAPTRAPRASTPKQSDVREAEHQANYPSPKKKPRCKKCSQFLVKDGDVCKHCVSDDSDSDDSEVGGFVNPPPPKSQSSEMREAVLDRRKKEETQHLLQAREDKWICESCTFANDKDRPGCEMCAANRPPILPAPMKAHPVPAPMKAHPVPAPMKAHPVPAPMKAHPVPAPTKARLVPVPVPRSKTSQSEGQARPQVKGQKEGWTCGTCSFLNKPSRPGCEMCTGPPPAGYVVVEDAELEEKNRHNEEVFLAKWQAETNDNVKKLMAKQDMDIIEINEEVECSSCFVEADPGNAIQLRNCGHPVCKGCISDMVRADEKGSIECPKCQMQIDDRDVKNVIDPGLWDRRLALAVSDVAKAIENVFYCQSVDCKYFVEICDDVNEFVCPSCKQRNCLVCKAIHELKQTCREYQDKIKLDAQNNENARLTMEMFEDMIKTGDALRCPNPNCSIILMKKDGCDWVRCSSCKTEICWATRGPRWGPKGRGDLSGGCQCRVGGKRCTPTCKNCH